MEAYTDFAALYDRFMEETPYDEWCGFLVEKLNKYGISGGLVCELGAGTGAMTRRFRDKGYDMIGIDNSDSMLAVAQEYESDDSILYLCQDMREFELYGTVGAVVSVCDSINYITEPDELCEVFKLCNNYLDPNGILIFDFNTKYKYSEIIGETTIAQVDDDAGFIWDNYYDEETAINQYDITFFTKEGSGLYRRFDETHFQRGYDLEEIKALLSKAGMVFLEAIDADTFGETEATSERIFVVAREQGK
ncbi:MAG: class I SAM-dependent methyltransferase [Lachnospiraceae bacterium]|nr:class I SAM-dependent methyltransferase [Lachnospiraceae bacterium]